MTTEKEYQKIKNMPSIGKKALTEVKESIERMKGIQKETEQKLRELLL